MNRTVRVALVLALVMMVLIIMTGQLQWTQQQTSSDGQLQKQQKPAESSIPDRASYCASENNQCLCSGTVIYGAINGRTINALHPVRRRDGFTSLEQMQAAPHLTKQVDGKTQCVQGSFVGQDPEFGAAKYCRCIPSTEVSSSVSVLQDSVETTGIAGNRQSMFTTSEAIVPLLSVSLAVDPHRWLYRLLESIDAPIGRILVQIGNPDSAILEKLQQQIDEALEKNSQYLGSNVEVTRLDHNPGCTNGWNTGMRPMIETSEEELPWAVIVNSDVAFHPGSLAALSEYMSSTLASDARFGLGHLNIHPPWSGFAATWRLATRVGLFDENIYPVGYEDNDYSIRVQLANLRVSTVKVANVQHNVNYDGSDSKIAQSGTGIALKDRATGQQLQGLLNRGQAAARAYLQRKWGGHIVPTFFKGPFNDERIPVSEWPELPALREHIVSGRGSLEQALRPIDDLISRYSSQPPIEYKEPAFRLKEEPTFCALEGEQCSCEGEVIYGPVLRGKWGDSFCDDDHYAGTTSLEQMQQGPHNIKEVSGSVPCTTPALGDPHCCELKYCRCLKASDMEFPDGSTFCAYENESCSCIGSVVFGAKYKQGVAKSKSSITSLDEMLQAPHLRMDTHHIIANAIICSNESFDGDDPSFGESKYCRCINDTM